MSPKKKAVTKKVSKKVETKNIGFKNYLYAFLILVGGIVFIFLSFKWYQLKTEEKLMKSYLITSNTIVTTISDLDEFNHIMQEAPSSYFIYLSYTGDKNVYEMEKDLKLVIDKYNINDIFYYIDVTELKENDQNYLNKIKETLNISDLEKVPAVVYVNEGEILNRNVLDGVKGTDFKAEDLESLLEIYEYDTVK